MDKIYIRDLLLRCIIGVYPEERRERQEVVVNLEILCDLRAAGRSDDLSESIDYKAVKKAILELAEKSRFQLIEALAEGIAEIVLRDPRAKGVVVTVDKPGALRFARSAAVEITRLRED